MENALAAAEKLAEKATLDIQKICQEIISPPIKGNGLNIKVA